MKTQTKRLGFGLAVLIAGSYCWVTPTKGELLQVVASRKPQTVNNDRDPEQPSTATSLRYDPLNDRRLSSEAAAIYFPRREKLIRSNHGDAQIDNISKGLKSGKDLLEWLGRVQSHELASALPFVADLLDHQDNSVRRVAAETLCWFGDKRGFDFILKRRGQDDGFEWSATFQKVFTEYLPVGYNEPLVKLMREKNGDKISQKIDAYGIAEENHK